MRKKRKSDDGGFNIWRSYSDMMAGVLLLFVLIMCVTLFQAQKNYDDSIRERDQRLAMKEEYTSELQVQDEQLEEQRARLSELEATLQEQQATLDEQAATLEAQSAKLDEQAATLKNQKKKLTAQQTALDEKTDLLAAQQQKIDNIIGVKAEVIESLKNEFKQNNVNVNIDTQSGAMTLESNVMFAVNEAELTEEGKAVLSSVLPIYCTVLLQEEHLTYLAEIIIDGYTDTDGDYNYNLELSQQRSLAVAQYLLEIAPQFLSEEDTAKLEEHLTVNGHSMSNPILDAQGNVDKDASRRVEVKFRLKDEEMIQELNSILTQTNE
ncbi:MAG: OmpA family protein [Eubacteriales bacterium]|nr:OmpA family protein [Eubacteriales bacterium]